MNRQDELDRDQQRVFEKNFKRVKEMMEQFAQQQGDRLQFIVAHPLNSNLRGDRIATAQLMVQGNFRKIFDLAMQGPSVWINDRSGTPHFMEGKPKGSRGYEFESGDEAAAYVLGALEAAFPPQSN